MKWTGPIARPLAPSLAPLTHSLARSAALIHSFARSFTHSGAHGKEIHVYELNALISYSFNSTHSASVGERLMTTKIEIQVDFAPIKREKKTALASISIAKIIRSDMQIGVKDGPSFDDIHTSFDKRDGKTASYFCHSIFSRS